MLVNPHNKFQHLPSVNKNGEAGTSSVFCSKNPLISAEYKVLVYALNATSFHVQMRKSSCSADKWVPASFILETTLEHSRILNW